MLPVLLIFILLQTSKIHANLEDYLISDIGEEFLYPDAIEEKPRRNQEVESTKRRTGGDSNFVRFGRSDKISAFDEDVDYDDLEFLVRPTRSKTNPTDRHLRFGRSKPSFIRFGRTDPKSSFLRFGRSSSDYQRSKRDVYDSPQQSTSKGASNFVRFGRNDYFMRFGREKLADRIRLPPTKPSTDDVRNLEGGRYGVRGQLRSEIRAQLKRLMMEGERFKGPERFVKVLGRIEGDVKE